MHAVRIFILQALIVVGLMLSAAVAFAQASDTASDPSVLSLVLNHLLEIVSSLLIIVVGVGIRKGSKWLDRVAGINLSKKEEDLLQSFARKGVNYARNRATKTTDKHTKDMKAPEVIEDALSFALARAQEHGLVKAGKSKLEAYVRAELGDEEKLQEIADTANK